MISELHRDRYKRGFDLAIIAFAHLLFFPVVLLVWTLIPLAIWLEDRGPIFYTQRRAGKGPGRPGIPALEVPLDGPERGVLHWRRLGGQ